MPETTPLIKAALNLRVGAGFDVYDRPYRPAQNDPFSARRIGIPLRLAQGKKKPLQTSVYKGFECSDYYLFENQI